MNYKYKSLQKLLIILSYVSLFFQSFYPYIAIVPAVFAQDKTVTELEFRRDTYEFNLKVNTKAKVKYSLIYRNNDQNEQIASESEVASVDFERNFYAGTCSEGGVCVPNEVSRGVLKIEVAVENYQTTKKFIWENNNLQILEEEDKIVQFDLTEKEKYWLETGAEPTPVETLPTPTPTPAGEILDKAVQIEREVTPVIASIIKEGEIETVVKQVNQCFANSLNGCVITDKEDYTPNEVVFITGHGFSPNTPYILVIKSETGPMESQFGIVTTEQGSFDYSYQLDGTYRPDYLVEVKDVNNQLLASVTFTDHFNFKVYINSNSSLTNSLAVTLNLSWDTLPIIGQDPILARYANDMTPGNSCSNLGSGSWTPWEPIVDQGGDIYSKSWLLASGGEGERKVCVETRHPLFLGLSHVLLDSDKINYEIQRGTITIVKNAEPNDPQDFTFQGTLGDIILDDDPSDTTYESSITFADLMPSRQYSISEDQTKDWELNDITCTGASQYESDLVEYSVMINLQEGEDVVCTFTNKKQISNVKVCKTNSAEVPLSGWRVALLGDSIDSFNVGSNGSPVSRFYDAGDYAVVSSGTYNYGDSRMEADAANSYRHASLPCSGGVDGWVNGDLNSCMNHYLSLNPSLSSGPTEAGWGHYFNSDHTYAKSFSGGNLDLKIWDSCSTTGEGCYGDNEGSLQVAVHEGFVGDTDPDGCIEFSDVPYGSYELIEILQQGWEKVNGEGPITVDEETEIFFIVNREIPVAPTTTPTPTSTPTPAPFCGDGVVNSPTEQCDGDDRVSEGKFCTPMCKLVPVYGGARACSAGRAPVLRSTYSIDSQSAGGLSVPVTSGTEYLLSVEGVYSYNVNSSGRLADSAYATNDNWGSVRPDIGIWGTNRGVTSVLGDFGSGMGVIEWDNDSSFDSDHQYELAFTPTINSLQFLISDWYGDWYAGSNNQASMRDNRGSLTLKVSDCLDTGTLQGRKYNDINGNGDFDTSEKTDTNRLDGWWIRLFDTQWNELDSMQTGNDGTLAGAVDKGQYRFVNVLPGSYYVCEDVKSEQGWDQTEPSSGPIRPTVGGYCHSITLLPGQDLTEIQFGNINQGKIIIDKVTIPSDNPTAFDFEIKQEDVSKASFSLDDAGEPNETMLRPGTYSVSETIVSGWNNPIIECISDFNTRDDLIGRGEFRLVGEVHAQPAPLNPDSLNLRPGETITCTFTNEFIPPLLTISKFNNKWPNDQLPGDSVDYTIALEVLENNVNDVVVTDLPPAGFTYRGGSGKAFLNGSLMTTVPEPVYSSPGDWNLGDLNEGDVVELKYTADIAENSDLGLYKDMTFAYGCSDLNQTESCEVTGETAILALAHDSGKNDSGVLTDNYVGTKINLNKETQDTVSYKVEKTETREGSVLGASTTTKLPATGANSHITKLMFVLFLGSLFILLSQLLKPKKRLLAVIMFVGLFISVAQVNAVGYLNVRLGQPKSPNNLNSFKLDFVAMDMTGEAITAECYQRKSTAVAYTLFETHTLKAGGNSGVCSVSSSIINENGTYQFYVKAVTNSNSANSEVVTVDYNKDLPSTPVGYSKDHPTSCEYKLTIRTANDGGRTSKVEIYRSDKSEFTADSGNRITAINAASNEVVVFNDSVPDCSKTYYYVVRAFNQYGNGSGLVGDANVTVTLTGASTTSSEAVGTNEPVFVGNANVPQGEVQDEAGAVLGEDENVKQAESEGSVNPETSGEVLGASTKMSWWAKFKANPLIGFIAFLSLAVLFYALYRYIKGKNSQS